MEKMELKNKKEIKKTIRWFVFPFNLLSIILAVTGLVMLYFWISYISKNAPRCPNIEDGRECWSYLKLLPWFTLLLLSVISYLEGRRLLKKYK